MDKLKNVEGASIAPERATTAGETSPKYTSVGGVPLAPEVIVRGGTMSMRQEAQIRKNEDDANRRRAYQDRQQEVARTQNGPNTVASIHQKRLITEDSPRLALWYRKYDQYCLSEITMVNPPGTVGMEPMFTLVCARCLERGVPQGQAQLQVLNSNRRFSVDDTKRGPKKIHSSGIPQVVQICGTVTVEETIRCGAAGCGWAVKITDSKVEEV